MCSGGRGASTVPVSDPVVSNVSSNETTQSAAMSTAKKQRRRSGADNNAVSSDRTILGSSGYDNTVQNKLG